MSSMASDDVCTFPWSIHFISSSMASGSISIRNSMASGSVHFISSSMTSGSISIRNIMASGSVHFISSSMASGSISIRNIMASDDVCTFPWAHACIYSNEEGLPFQATLLIIINTSSTAYLLLEVLAASDTFTCIQVPFRDSLMSFLTPCLDANRAKIRTSIHFACGDLLNLAF